MYVNVYLCTYAYMSLNTYVVTYEENNQIQDHKSLWK